MVPPVSIGPGGWDCCCAEAAFLPFFPDAEAAAGFFRSPAPSTIDETDDEPPRTNRIDPWEPWRCKSSAASAAFFFRAFSFDLASLQTGQCLSQKPPECSVHSLRLLTVKQWDVQPGMVVMVGTSRAISKRLQHRSERYGSKNEHIMCWFWSRFFQGLARDVM